jgi:hypothetical protein
VPKVTTIEIVEKLNKEINAALAEANVVSALAWALPTSCSRFPAPLA